MIVSIIAAVAENGVIGKDNDLVWSLPVDMDFFKRSTKGHHVIMGRRNYESIPHKYRPLPGRPNVVLTRNADYEAEGSEVCHSLEDALRLAADRGEQEAFVIGGGKIYELALNLDVVDVMYLTEVHAEYQGDTLFPEFDKHRWSSEDILFHPADEKHEAAFTIRKWTKLN
jgi:dihydrofolate reductase